MDSQSSRRNLIACEAGASIKPWVERFSAEPKELCETKHIKPANAGGSSLLFEMNLTSLPSRVCCRLLRRLNEFTLHTPGVAALKRSTTRL
jgi:hypothetical protein